MAPAPVNLCLVLLLLLFLSSGGTINTVDAQKTWCVAKPSTGDITLKDDIEYACSQVDCSVIERGEPCFYPDTLISHASVAMNLYYQSRGGTTGTATSITLPSPRSLIQVMEPASMLSRGNFPDLWTAVWSTYQ